MMRRPPFSPSVNRHRQLADRLRKTHGFEIAGGESPFSAQSLAWSCPLPATVPVLPLVPPPPSLNGKRCRSRSSRKSA